MNKKGSSIEDELLLPENMIKLYSRGAFPMAEETGKINWYMPEIRSVIPLDNFNIPKSLKKFMASSGFTFRYDFDQMQIIKKCADREVTWIAPKLIDAYEKLNQLGYIHSVEVWLENKLVGGLYGIQYKGAFFGESMFSKIEQASKSALVKLFERLSERGFTLLDVQFMTDHLRMFGAKEIIFAEYLELLNISYLNDPKFS